MKFNLKFINIFLLIMSLSIISGCGADGIGGTGYPVPSLDALYDGESGETVISGYSIPLTDNGYINFNTTVFHNQEELDVFIKKVNEQIFTITINREASEASVQETTHYALAYIVDKDVNELVFSSDIAITPIDLTGTSAAQGKLIKTDEFDLLDYFQTNAKSQSVQNLRWNSYSFDLIEPGLESISVDSVDPVADIASEEAIVNDSSGVSSTNIQEEGVDEADLIKTDGRYLYSIDKTDFSDHKIRVMDTQSETGLAEVDLISVDHGENSRWNIEGLYLHEAQDRLVALSTTITYPEYDSIVPIDSTEPVELFDDVELISIEPAYYEPPTYTTDVMFIDTTDPSATSIETSLSFDGNLVDSRRNGDTLYVILEGTSYYQYIDNDTLLDSELDEFLPSYSVNDAPKQLITVANDCYIEEGQKRLSNIVTLLAIDLNSTVPNINSECFVGPTEALYASQNALYLATTRYDYQMVNGENIYETEVTVDIHKFAYEGLNFDYRGSGEVDGHLGFNNALKSFRFSEKDGYLRVVTYDVDQWSIVLTL